LPRLLRLPAGQPRRLRAADETSAGYTTQRLRGRFYHLVTSAALRKITFYLDRHSALSYLLNSGQAPICGRGRAWAGHAYTGAASLKHYIRVRPDDLEARQGRHRRAPRRVRHTKGCELL
jgi:hypothetical protein